jgi:WhiB family transcriptional regulator, redox-sensing transcriptional regulator
VQVITDAMTLVDTMDGMPVGGQVDTFVVIEGGQDVVEEPDWQERALCAQTDPEAFFPEKGGSTREAKRICSGCDVRAECLDYALAHDERFGIWGGLSERERRRLKHRVI